MEPESIKSTVKGGGNWKHKISGRVVIVLETPHSKYASVRLLHQSGRKTSKEQHYFLYEYERI